MSDAQIFTIYHIMHAFYNKCSIQEHFFQMMHVPYMLGDPACLSFVNVANETMILVTQQDNGSICNYIFDEEVHSY